jgi:hypothetical protein
MYVNPPSFSSSTSFLQHADSVGCAVKPSVLHNVRERGEECLLKHEAHLFCAPRKYASAALGTTCHFYYPTPSYSIPFPRFLSFLSLSIVSCLQHANTQTHHSPLTTHHSPLTTHHSPLTTHHSPLTTHHAPRTTHHAPRTTHHAPRTTHHAPRTTHHAPRTTHHSPRTTHHSPRNTQ